MTKTMRQEAEFATYFIPGDLNQQGAEEVLNTLNTLLSAYTSQGWVAMHVIPTGPSQLQLPGGQLNGSGMNILWTKKLD